MATKFYLRVGAFYKSLTGKSLTSDIEITDIVNDTDPDNPFIEDDGSIGGANVESITAGTNVTLGGTASNPVINASGGSVSIPATAYASNADAVAALGVGVLYKSTTLINDSPIILITV